MDTQGFAALKHRRDSFYEQAHELHKSLCQEGSLFITTNFVVDETLTLLRVRVGHWLAVEFGEEIRKPSYLLTLVTISREIEETAWTLFRRRNGKLNWSFTDCTSFALMKELGIHRAFTHDHNFEQAGFIKLLV
jgi:predicted nucleic acid-binding protein